MHCASEAALRCLQVKQEAGPPTGPPTHAELVAYLRREGPVTPRDLATQFRKRLRTPADKQAFTALTKRVANHKEREPGSGIKYVMLK